MTLEKKKEFFMELWTGTKIRLLFSPDWDSAENVEAPKKEENTVDLEIHRAYRCLDSIETLFLFCYQIGQVSL